jgi:hypothetical protein
MKRTPIETWQPVPEQYMHRGERIVLAVASPGPSLVGLVACDDTGMTCGFNFLARSPCTSITTTPTGPTARSDRLRPSKEVPRQRPPATSLSAAGSDSAA